MSPRIEINSQIQANKMTNQKIDSSTSQRFIAGSSPRASTTADRREVSKLSPRCGPPTSPRRDEAGAARVHGAPRARSALGRVGQRRDQVEPEGGELRDDAPQVRLVH